MEAAVERDLLAELLHSSIGREKALEEEVLRLEALVRATEERAKRAEGLVRAKDEAIGELLELVERPVINGWVPGVDFCSCWDIGRSCNCYCGYEARRTA